MKNTLLATRKLCKTFSSMGRQQHVLKNLDVEIYQGDFTVIMGPSGAGKSTLLYALSGMDKPTMGEILFSGRDISKLSNDRLALFRRAHCGFVFQQTYLLDNMSLLDNVIACGLLVSKNRGEVARRAKEILRGLHLEEGIWGKFPAQVSGGEGQRAGIARALINQPEIIFADEPTGSLNSANGQAVLDALTEVNRQKQSVVMVTHDVQSARRGNRIVYFRDGVIVGECLLGAYQSGDAQRNTRLKNFLSEMGW
ncbi:MAG: ABC transporter ATP-binding protein [Defluviitaleaceae bacterium]|nr:ABC transporter ATP-binding protein [Defluviitaleaceae bacterium]MCL2238610.1 ABC transporter ATP-binding protein [Defluviitaleaceae bacterium]